MEWIDPWIDTAEVRRLAERLMTPSHRPVVTSNEAGFEADFQGYTTGPAEEVKSQAPAPIPAKEPAPQVVSEPVPNVAHPTFLNIVRHFCRWMSENFSARDIFILDRNGGVVFDETDHGRLHFPARSLALASGRPGSSVEYVHVKIHAAATLEVIPVETANTYLVLGAVVQEPLSPTDITAVKEAMILLAGAQASPRSLGRAV